MSKPIDLKTLGLLAIGFAFSALSQALVAGMLPLAASLVVGTSALTFLPYGTLLVGMALSSLLASLLIDRIGRREGLSLGAALGTAGGLLLAISIIERHFAGMLLASFWLGIAQGFGLYYRHLATTAGRYLTSGSAVGVILGAGVLAGLAGPGLAALAEGLFIPYVFVGTALLAALAHSLMIAAAALLPSSSYVLEGEVSAEILAGDVKPLPATLMAAYAWFVMAAAMAATPLGMAGCGIGLSGIVGGMAWHVIAMYAPALVAGPAANRFGAQKVALAGIALSSIGAVLAWLASSLVGFYIALGLIGAGWSFTVIGATILMSAQREQGRIALAIHDGILVLGALFGVITVALLT